MANNVSAIKPRTAGCVYRAPLGTTLPTDATTALANTYVSLGYLSEDGITESNARESEDVKAYGGDTVATLQTSKTDTWQMTFIEVKNEEVLKTVYGDDNVSGSIDSGLTVSVNSTELDECVWVIDQVMSEGVLMRTVIPRGKPTEIGEIQYQDGAVTGFETTLTAYPYSTWADNATAKKYITVPSA